MDFIEKVTVVYDPLEDRLRLSVQTKKSESYVLWLTARLSIAVVAAIIKNLDKAVPADSRQEQKSLQQWEQSSALHKLKATAAVEVCTSQGELVQAVDVSVCGEDYILTFRGVKGTAARLSLTGIQMRQWLQIVYAQFLIAKWSMVVWPVWFDRGKIADRPLQPKVLH